MYLRSLKKVILVQILTLFQGLAFTYLATRILEPKLFGQLRYLLVWLPILMVTTVPTYDNLILRESSKKRKLNLTRISLYRLKYGVYSMLCLIVVVLWLRLNFADKIPKEIFYLMILIPFYETFTGYKNYLLGLGFQNAVLEIQIRNRILSIFLLFTGFLLSLFKNFDVSLTLILFMTVQTLPNIYTYYSLGLYRKHKISSNFTGEKALSCEAIMTSAASLIWLLASNLDKIIIGYFLTSEDLAVYAVLLMLPIMFSQFLDACVTTWYREIFSPQLMRHYWKTISLIPLVGGLVATCFAIILHYLLPIVFGEFYSYSWYLSSLGGVYAVSSSLELIQFQIFYRFKAIRSMYVYNVISVVILFLTLALTLHYIELSVNLILIVVVMKQCILPAIFLLVSEFRNKIC